MVKVRNNKSVETMPGYGGIWKPGETRDITDPVVAAKLADMPGFTSVPDDTETNPDTDPAAESASLECDVAGCARKGKPYVSATAYRDHMSNKHGVEV